jgi:hypothetical protein
MENAKENVDALHAIKEWAANFPSMILAPAISP